MSSGSSASFCLIVCFLVCSSEGQEIITADLGKNVTLPCKADNNKPITAVEWNRPGLDPEYVLFYRDGRFDLEYQHPSYKNRVDLKNREMKDGDVSMIMKNVKMEDRGRYDCHVFQRGTNHRKRSILNNDPISRINLEVLPPGDKDGGGKDGGDKNGGDKVGGYNVGGDEDVNTGDGGNNVGISLGVVGFLLLVVTLVGFLIYKRRNMRQNVNLPVPPDEAAAEQIEMN